MSQELDAVAEELKKIAIKHAKELAKEAIVVAAFPALKLAVSKSETKVDDAILAALEEPLKAQLIALLDKIEV